MIRSNLIMILLVTVCISGLHLYQIYHYTIRQNQKEIMTMSEQAQNGLNYMLNQLDVLQYQIVDSLTQSAEYDRNSRDWTRESIEFLKNTENQLQTFRRAVPFVTNIYWLDNYGKLFTTDSFVNRELFKKARHFTVWNKKRKMPVTFLRSLRNTKWKGITFPFFHT